MNKHVSTSQENHIAKRSNDVKGLWQTWFQSRKKNMHKAKNKKNPNKTYIGINTADSRVESHAESSVLLE